MVSIVIPVYNTSKEELLRCVDSILVQAYSDFEIVIIDDGSKYISEKDFSEIKRIDARIVIVHHHNNMGVSSARNTGIDNAHGDYIAFVDGDDEIDSRFLVESTQLANKYDADLVIGTLQYITGCNRKPIDEDDTEYSFKGEAVKVLRRSHLYMSNENFHYTVLGSSSARLIHRELARKCRYDKNISIYEDQIFNRKLLLYASSAVYIHHVWYYYYQYTTSSYHMFEKNYGRDAIRFNINYLKATNDLNLIEPDGTLRQELISHSLREFAVAISYWVIQKKDSQLTPRMRIKEIEKLYVNTDMQDIINACQLRRVRKPDIAMLYLLLKHKQFGLIFYLLKGFDRLRREKRS